MSEIRVDEIKSSETKLSKTVSRHVAVILGMICFVLVIASLLEAFAYYTPIINDKRNRISSLNSKITSLNASLNNRILGQNHTISSLDTQLASLEKQASNAKIFGTGSSSYFFEDNWTVTVEAGSGTSPSVTASSGNINASSGYVVAWVSSKQ